MNRGKNTENILKKKRRVIDTKVYMGNDYRVINYNCDNKIIPILSIF